MKRAHLVAIVSASLLGTLLGIGTLRSRPEPLPPTRTALPGEPFALTVGQSATVGGARVTLRRLHEPRTTDRLLGRSEPDPALVLGLEQPSKKPALRSLDPSAPAHFKLGPLRVVVILATDRRDAELVVTPWSASAPLSPTQASELATEAMDEGDDLGNEQCEPGRPRPDGTWQVRCDEPGTSDSEYDVTLDATGRVMAKTQRGGG